MPHTSGYKEGDAKEEGMSHARKLAKKKRKGKKGKKEPNVPGGFVANMAMGSSGVFGG